MEEKTLKGVATLLKTPEGEIKLPRTAAVLVQTSSGSNVETELAKLVSKDIFNEELNSLIETFEEFSDTLKEFRYDIGTSANYTELALVNREASELYKDLKIALEDMEVFIKWEERWKEIQDTLEGDIDIIKTHINQIEIDMMELTIRLKLLEEKESVITDVNLSSMLASVDVFEMMINNNMVIDETKLDNITLIYTELLKMDVKGINEMPDIIKERIVKQLLL